MNNCAICLDDINENRKQYYLSIKNVFELVIKITKNIIVVYVMLKI